MDEKTEIELRQEHQKIKDLAIRNEARIKKLEKGQEELKDLTNAVTKMVTEQEHIREDLVEMKTDVKSLKEKPAKRYDAIVEKVLMLIVGGVVGYLLLKLGMPVG